MCGIAGVVDRGGVEPHGLLVDEMLQSLAHRGPDDHALQVETHAVLGARRLAIIDVAGGRQPVSSEDGSIVAVQNGEIYNYLELREQLRARGHVLRSDGDTETIVHLYEDFGDAFVERLRGMFALAVWDVRRDRLLLARDRLGKKPLHWRLDHGRLSFGSELKALVVDPAVPRTIDTDALRLFLEYQYVPAPLTIFRGISKLPPASTLTWDGGEPVVRRYWWPDYEPKHERNPEDDREACLDILREAVRIRLRSDVPVGSFLSGGIDSSVVTALMVELSAGPVRTYTIGFESARLDERPQAEAVARHLGTLHTSEIVSLDAVDLLPRFAQAFDEPFGDPSAIPTLRVAQLAAADLKVVLTGDGGDEVFGGYDRYRVDARLDRWQRRSHGTAGPITSMAAHIASAVAPGSHLQRRVASGARLMRGEQAERYDDLMRIMSPDVVRSLLGPDVRPSGYLRQAWSGLVPAAPLDRDLRVDTFSYLPEDLLVKMDRATMAYSLEARSPLLDHELVEFAARLPVNRKLAGDRSKVVLREVARSLLPDELVDRPKKGFSVPIQEWFRGPIGERFADLALGRDAYLRDVVDQDVARQLLADHQAGIAERGRWLWQLLVLELWGRSWARSSAAAPGGASSRDGGSRLADGSAGGRSQTI